MSVWIVEYKFRNEKKWSQWQPVRVMATKKKAKELIHSLDYQFGDNCEYRVSEYIRKEGE